MFACVFPSSPPVNWVVEVSHRKSFRASVVWKHIKNLPLAIDVVKRGKITFLHPQSSHWRMNFSWIDFVVFVCLRKCFRNQPSYYPSAPCEERSFESNIAILLCKKLVGCLVFDVKSEFSLAALMKFPNKLLCWFWTIIEFLWWKCL